MKKLLFFILLISISCTKEAPLADGTNSTLFNQSLKMISETLEENKSEKIYEAVSIIKNYGTQMETEDLKESKLRQMLNKKSAEEIFTLAEKIAFKYDIKWDRNSPGNLRNLEVKDIANIDKDTQEQDYSQINNASKLLVETRNLDQNNDGVEDGLMVFLQLRDQNNTIIEYQNLDLDAQLLLFNNENQVYSRRANITNSMVGNVSLRRGIIIPYSLLNKNKINSDLITIEAKINTPETYFTNNKLDIPIAYQDFLNNKATLEIQDSELENDKEMAVNKVNEFLELIGTRKLREAHSLSNNPDWKNYAEFSSKTKGFGSVKNLKIENISFKNVQNQNATVYTEYIVKDSINGSLLLKQNFNLKKQDGNWVITKVKTTEKPTKL